MFRIRSSALLFFLPMLASSLARAQAPSASGSASSSPSSLSPAESPAAQSWCAPGIQHLPSGVCYAAPSSFAANRPRTLVIFLHGVTQDGTTWQWNPQRGMSLASQSNGFAVLMPRGRLGISRHGSGEQWTWPTAHVAQQQVETEVLAEWGQARKELEALLGAPFERVWVFGFSNGAYYATSLALRGRFPADGFAVFAGGGAPDPFPRSGPAVRAPIYVGYGLRDRAHKDPRQLGVALRHARWPSRVVAKAGVGHSIADSQLREAIEFLNGHGPESAPTVHQGRSSRPARAPSHSHARPSKR